MTGITNPYVLSKREQRTSPLCGIRRNGHSFNFIVELILYVPIPSFVSKWEPLGSQNTRGILVPVDFFTVGPSFVRRRTPYFSMMTNTTNVKPSPSTNL